MKKKEPWRWIVGILSICYIVYMWIRKGIGDVWSTLPAEDLLPLVLTNLAVSLIKVAILAGFVLLVRLLVTRFRK